MPTRGLLAGSTKVYSAQLEFEGAPEGHATLDETERLALEVPSAGMVTSRVKLLPMEMVCRAETEASMVAAADPDFAVTNPWNIVGPVLVPASGANGNFPRFVPPDTPTATVALKATPAPLIAAATTSNVAPDGSGQKLKLPLGSATVCSKMTSVPVLSCCSSATRTAPFTPAGIGCSVT